MSKLRDRRSESYNSETIVKGLGATYIKVDGNNYIDVYTKISKLLPNIAEGNPTVFECITYRHMAHSAPITDDKIGYRETDTIEERKKQDPIDKIKALLLVDDAQKTVIENIEKEVTLFCSDTIQKASSALYPDKTELYTNIYA